MILKEDDLVRWGRAVGESVETPVFIGLKGQLGAGKSVFARAVAAGAGVKGEVPSPTFNLLFRYEGSGVTEVVHIDLYRVEEPADLWELGWEEIGSGNELVLVEWPERAGDLLPPDRWEVELTVPHGARQLRQVSVEKVGRPPGLPGYPIDVSPREPGSAHRS